MESLDSERVLTICLSVWSQHRSVSSRQTDGQTECYSNISLCIDSHADIYDNRD